MPNPTPTPQPSSTPVTPPVNTAPQKTVVDAKVTPDTQKAPVPQSEEMFEVQIDGRVEKKSKKEILEAYQLRQLSDKRRSEADKVLSEFKKLQEVGAKDPIKLMKAMGYDFDNIATAYLAKKAEDAMKDPKVLEAEQLKAENEQYKKWVEEQKSAQENQKVQAERAEVRQKLHQEIIEEVERAKDLGLPVDEDLVVAIAQQMLIQDKAKKPLSAKEALPATYAKTQKWLQGLANKMDGESLVKWLGEDTAKKIRKYDLSKLKAKRSTPDNQALVKPKQEVNKPKEAPYKTWSDFKRDTLDKIKQHPTLDSTDIEGIKTAQAYLGIIEVQNIIQGA